MGNCYGYVRVSSVNQYEDRQIIVMHEQGITDGNIFIDKQSGKDFERPAYQELLKILKKNDLIYVMSIDRLGRNYSDIIEQWSYITKELKADIVVIDMPILDTRTCKDLMGTFLSDVVLALLSYVAENERNAIRSRQASGIAAAKMRGVKFGRPSYPLPENFYEQFELWKEHKIKLKDAAKNCGMPDSTFLYKARKYKL